MSMPNITDLPWLQIKELESGKFLNTMIRVSPNSILCFFSYDRGDDIEVAAGIGDFRAISALFNLALGTIAKRIDITSTQEYEVLQHRFDNLDGGANAEFRIYRKPQSFEVVVERSDEGNFEFRISFEDTRKLRDYIESALEFNVHSPSS